MTPKRAFGGAMLLLAGLFIIQPGVPSVSVAEAASHEGHTVSMAGTAASVRPWGDGLRIVLHADGHALPVEITEAAAASGPNLSS